MRALFTTFSFGPGFLGPLGCLRNADNFTFAESCFSTDTNLDGVIR